MSVSTAEPPRLMTAKDAAAYLAISPRKLAEMVSTREVPCLHIGRALRFARDELDRWIESKLA